MWYLLISFIVLVISVFLGIEIAEVNNYVLVVYNHWIIQSSLWVAFIVLVVVFVVAYIVCRLLGKAARATKRYHYWKNSRRYRKARLLTQYGLCQLAEGDWPHAEENLLKAAKLNKRPLVDYLAAAKAAQQQHAYDRRDNYLRLAHQADKEAAIAIGLTQAQLQMEANQWEQALAILQHLYQRAPQHHYILKLLTEVQVHLKEWAQCLKLLPAVKKHEALAPKEYENLQRTVYFALLVEAQHKDTSILIAYWKSLPRHYRQEPEFNMAYISALLDKQQDELAAESLEAYLKKQWHAPLLALYSQIRFENALAQLEIAEQWLKKHPTDPLLLLCLGQLSHRAKLWGKAKDYLQQSIELHPSATAYQELGKLYELLNENHKALNCYRMALTVVPRHHSVGPI